MIHTQKRRKIGFERGEHPFQARVEELVWIFDSRSAGEGELEDLLIRLPRADDAVMGPDRCSHPFPFLLDVRIDVVDELTDMNGLLSRDNLDGRAATIRNAFLRSWQIDDCRGATTMQALFRRDVIYCRGATMDDTLIVARVGGRPTPRALSIASFLR